MHLTLFSKTMVSACVVSIFKLKLCTQADGDLLKLTDFRKSKFFRNFVLLSVVIAARSLISARNCIPFEIKAMVFVLSMSTNCRLFKMPSSPQFLLQHGLRTTNSSS
jgi:hypothetical protein